MVVFNVVHVDLTVDGVDIVVCEDVGGNKIGAPDGGMTKVAVSAG